MAGKKKTRFPDCDLWKFDGQDFYRFTSFGRDPERERIKDRCFGYIHLFGNTWMEFCDSRPIADWRGGQLIVAQDTPLDDMPNNTLGLPIVSRKLLEVIQRTAPCQVEAYPISVKQAAWQMKIDGEVIVHEEESVILCEPGEYSILNTLVELKCMDWNAKKNDYWEDDVIQADKIPLGVILFRIIDQGASIVCRRQLRIACDEAGIRGAQFRRVKYTQ